MLKLHRKIVRRTYQCDMPGCRNRVNELNSRRADASSNPMHICNQCVIDLFRERGLSLGEEPTAERGALEVNGGAEAVVASILTVPDEIDTFDPGAGLPEIHPPAEEEPKKEAEPKKAPKTARKPSGSTKTGGKRKTEGKV